MNLAQLETFLLWGWLINYAVLLFWFGFYTAGKNVVYRLHTRWFALAPEKFDAIHYAGIMMYKLAIFLFFLGPWIVVKFIL